MFILNVILSFLRDREYQKLLGVSSIILMMGTVVYHYLEGGHG